ncbi:MAG: hypothetical protein GX054_04225 [Clostridiales bacterium]|jgi:hypothetical protein|nr:hypothetical protein [Clostridiales bacterium]
MKPYEFYDIIGISVWKIKIAILTGIAANMSIMTDLPVYTEELIKF